jgi:hypothetical protein
MKNLVLMAVLILSGCSAALIDRLSTWPVDSDEKEPSVQILYYSPGAGNMHTYRLLVHNTLYVPIYVTLDCSTMGKEVFILRARTTRGTLIGGMSGRPPECNVSYTRE